MNFKENLMGGTSPGMTAESLPPTMQGIFRNPESLSKLKPCFTGIAHLSGISSEGFLTNLWGEDKIIKELTLECELLTCALSSVEQATCKCHRQTRYLLV